MIDQQSDNYETKNWKFTAIRSKMANCNEMDQLSEELECSKLPSIVQYNAEINIENQLKNFSIKFTAKEAIKQCKQSIVQSKQSNNNIKSLSSDNNNNILQHDNADQLNEVNSCKYILNGIKCNNPWSNIPNKAEAWSDDKNLCEIKPAIPKIDWTFSSLYRGSFYGNIIIKYQDNLYEIMSHILNNEKDKYNQQQMLKQLPNQNKLTIPMERLTQNNPILWYKDIYLQEDDLDDVGYVLSHVRMRAMGDCFFLNQRTYTRVDHVLIRVNEIKLFIDINDDYMIRETSNRENNWNELNELGFNTSNSDWILAASEQCNKVQSLLKPTNLWVEQIAIN